MSNMEDILRDDMRKTNQKAAILTEVLGLPPEAKHAVLSAASRYAPELVDISQKTQPRANIAEDSHLKESVYLPRRSEPQRLTSLSAFTKNVLAVTAVILFFIGAASGVVYADAIHLNALPDDSTVIKQIQNISKLDTVSYTLEKVVTYDPDAGAWYHFLGDRTKVFIVDGEVTAGFDLSQLRKEDITEDTNILGTASVTLTMPAPQILQTNIDNEKTRIYDLNSSIYELWNQGLDPNTTVKILADAENSLRNDACQRGILQQASDSARSQLTSLLKAIGFSKVTMNIPAGTCS